MIPLSMRQYDDSPTIQAILNAWGTDLDINGIIDDIYTKCVNIDTCEGYWLDVWGVKIGIGRYIDVFTTEGVFGFDNTAHDFEPFDQGTFFEQSTASQKYALTDDAYRKIILAKAWANVTDCSAGNLNKLLQIVFAGRGNCYVIDFNDMTMDYFFSFQLEDWEKNILLNDLLPRPAGVLIRLNIFQDSDTFGFNEATDAFPFDDGIFYI
jgi:hypothetical protein